MEKVLNQAEQLAEAILESEEYIKMRIAETAAMRNEEAAGLIAAYAQRRSAVEALLTSEDIDRSALDEASENLEATEKAIDENQLIKAMREANTAFGDMMKQVNRIIKYVVTGEMEQAQEGCSGSCSSCAGCGH